MIEYHAYNENTEEFETCQAETELNHFMNTEFTRYSKNSENNELGCWVLIPYPNIPHRWEWRYWGGRTELTCETVLSTHLCCLLDGTDPDFDPIPF